MVPTHPRARRSIGITSILIALGAASCSSDTEPSEPTSSSSAAISAAAAIPAPPRRKPPLPDIAGEDRDSDRVDDRFDVANTSLDANESLRVEIVLNRPVEPADLATFEAEGGRIKYVFREVSYGFTGWIPRGRLRAMKARLGSGLHYVSFAVPTKLHLDEATRCGRVRAAWAPYFTDYASGFSGSSTTTIAILDSGIDSTHTDFSGRIIGFKNVVGSATTATDVHGHGTHVAGIAAGSGAAFGLTSGTKTLTYSSSSDLSGVTAGGYVGVPIHTPSYLNGAATDLTASASAVWNGGGNGTLRMATGDDASSSFTLLTTTLAGASPRSLSSTTTSNGAARFRSYLFAAATNGVTQYSVKTTIANYPAVGDGFNALRGVAPGCSLYGIKTSGDDGSGNSTDMGEGLDEVVASRVAKNIKVANLSGSLTANSTTIRAKAQAVAEAGVVLTVAAGNSGPSAEIYDPGRAGKVITVGATNDINQLHGLHAEGVLDRRHERGPEDRHRRAGRVRLAFDDPVGRQQHGRGLRHQRPIHAATGPERDALTRGR